MVISVTVNLNHTAVCLSWLTLLCVMVLCSLPLCRAMVELLKTTQLLPRHDSVANRSTLLENVKKTISSSAWRFSGHQQHVRVLMVVQ